MSFINCSKCGQENPVGNRFCFGCGATIQEVTIYADGGGGWEPGTRLRGDRYIIERQLLSEKFRKTYLAADTSRGEEKVAISELMPAVEGTDPIQKAEELLVRNRIALA